MITDAVDSLDMPWSLLLNFWLWAAVAALLMVWGWLTRNDPNIRRTYNKHLMKVGDLAYGGNGATSKVEKRVRSAIDHRNLGVLPGQLVMRTGLRDMHGNPRKFTPDIVVWQSKKDRTVVEVDPYNTHGQQGLHAVYNDIERNIAYTQAGYKVVRVRIGFPEGYPYTNLGFHDVVIPKRAEQMTDDDYRLIAASVRHAKLAGKKSFSLWKRMLDRLQAYKDAWDAHQMSKSARMF